MISAIERAMHITNGETTSHPQNSEDGPPALILGPNPTILVNELKNSFQTFMNPVPT